MANETTWKRWIQTQEAYSPEIEYAKDIGESLENFERHVAQKTRRPELNFDDLKNVLQENNTTLPSSELFFISRILPKNAAAQVDADAHKLQISSDAFWLMANHFNLPPAFLFALSRFYLPNREGLRLREIAGGDSTKTQWYFLPFRVPVTCTTNTRSHEASPTSSNQMDPFHYLHLPDEKVDIHGSQIAVYISQRSRTDKMVVLSFNFLLGRSPKIIKEPQSRIAEILKLSNMALDSTTVHSVFLTSIIQWWKDALHSVNMQLVAYEKRLQEDITEESRMGAFYNEITQGLHATAAHIYRYGTELDSLERIVSELVANFANRPGKRNSSLANLDTIMCQLKITNASVREQEKKVKNIQALLFNRMQISNDRILVDTLKATQEDAGFSRQIAERSQELSEEMKKDSMSMKTIAEVTMFFLPGATFAAILALPSVSNIPHLAKGQILLYIWSGLTFVVTFGAFCIYQSNKRQVEGKIVQAEEKIQKEV